jgi:hydrogenase nickel incorporation protein HypA/HybF
MHEVSIAESLLDIALRECTGKGFTEIRSITVRIGKASGIMPEALLFAFDAVKLDTAAHAAVLTIEEVPVAGHCRICLADFRVEEKYVFNCPHCGSGSFTVSSGRELEMREMEVL